MWDLQRSRAVQKGTHESDTLVILQAFPGYGLLHIYSVNLRREIPVTLRTGGSFLGVEESGYFINGKKTFRYFGNICKYSNSCSTYAMIYNFPKILNDKRRLHKLEKSGCIDEVNALLCTRFLSPHSLPSAASEM